jgi:hypothetical protein
VVDDSNSYDEWASPLFRTEALLPDLPSSSLRRQGAEVGLPISCASEPGSRSTRIAASAQRPACLIGHLRLVSEVAERIVDRRDGLLMLAQRRLLWK